MIFTITTSGMMSNQDSVGSANPRELHPFKFQPLHSMELEATEELVSINWYLKGSVPVGVTIDSKTGLISGYIETYSLQPALTNRRPSETTKENGSNWLNNGRPVNSTYTFTFEVCVDYVYKDLVLLDELGVPTTYNATAVSNVSILTVRDNNIDNLEFVKNYLVGKNRVLSYDGEDFTFNNWISFLKKHPGPFGWRKK